MNIPEESPLIQIEMSKFSFEEMLKFVTRRENPIMPGVAISCFFASPREPVHVWDYCIEFDPIHPNQELWDKTIHCSYAGHEPRFVARGQRRYSKPGLTGSHYLLKPQTIILSGIINADGNWTWEFIICDTHEEGIHAELLKEPRLLEAHEDHPVEADKLVLV